MACLAEQESLSEIARIARVESARALLPEVWQETSDPVVVARMACEIARVGEEGDIQTARSLVDEICSESSLIPPLWPGPAQILSSYARMAAERGGEVLKDAAEKVGMVPELPENVTKQRLLVILAHSKQPEHMQRAIDAVLKLDSYEEIECLIEIGEAGRTDLFPYAASLVAEENPDLGFYTRCSFYERLIEAGFEPARNRIAELALAEPQPSDSEELEYYLMGLSTAFQLSQRPEIKQQLREQLDSCPDCQTKVKLWVDLAPYDPDAIDKALKVVSRITDQEEADMACADVVKAYASQKSYEAAVELAEKIKVESAYGWAYRHIVDQEGMHMFERAVGALMQRSTVDGYNYPLEHLARCALWQGFVTKAESVVALLPRAEDKIKLLVEINQYVDYIRTKGQSD